MQLVGGRRPITMSCRNWWALRSDRRMTGVRTFRSVGTRWQLWLVQHVQFADHDDGIVIHERFASADVLTRLQALTPNIVVWAGDDFERAMELRELGVSGIIADSLPLLVRLRNTDADQPDA